MFPSYTPIIIRFALEIVERAQNDYEKFKCNASKRLKRSFTG